MWSSSPSREVEEPWQKISVVWILASIGRGFFVSQRGSVSLSEVLDQQAGADRHSPRPHRSSGLPWLTCRQSSQLQRLLIISRHSYKPSVLTQPVVHWRKYWPFLRFQATAWSKYTFSCNISTRWKPKFGLIKSQKSKKVFCCPCTFRLVL